MLANERFVEILCDGFSMPFDENYRIVLVKIIDFATESKTFYYGAVRASPNAREILHDLRHIN